MASITRAFDKQLYKLAAIDVALQAYADFATMTLDRAGDTWSVTFVDVDADFEPETVASEFANYVLAETVQRSR